MERKFAEAIDSLKDRIARRNVLIHHGVKGMHWGVRRYQNPDGTRIKSRAQYHYSSKDTVFLSGKVKYDEPLNKHVTRELDKLISAGSKVVIGDAPGADTRMQDYLNSRNYRNVVVYTTDKKVRNNVGKWTVKRITGKGADEREVRALKDKAMSDISTKALAISSVDDRPDSATSLNMLRMQDKKAPVKLYDYKTGRWVYR